MKRKFIIPLAIALAMCTTSIAFAADTVTAASSAATTTTEPAKAPQPAKTPQPPKAAATPSKQTTTVKPSVTVITPNGEATYTVVAGDTLGGIASKFNTTYQEIANLNNIASPYVIRENQVLAIPGTKAAPAPAVEVTAPVTTPVVEVAAPAPAVEVIAPAVVPIKEEVKLSAPALLDDAPLFPPVLVAEKPVEMPVPTTDVVTAASPKESSDPTALMNGLSEKGTWIFAILSDVKLDTELNVAGEFHSKDDPTQKVYRKLALYAQDADHNVTANYTLTVPKINVTTPNFRIQNGTVVGDIYVNADGFELSGTTVTGNVYFATEAQKASALLDKGTISGKTEVATAVDTVSAASPKESSDPTALMNGLSEKGTWIFAILSDVALDTELNVAGEFHSKDDPTQKVYRKLALYAQDAEHNVTANYTLTVPKINVTTPNFRIQNGTVVGDIYVNADGFELSGTTVKGNVYFANDAQMKSAILDKGIVDGQIAVQ